GRRIRHAEHYLALAEAAYPQLTGDPKQWLDRLEVEQDNLRAALDELPANGALALAGALWKFWSMHGHFKEGVMRLEHALANDASRSPERARALNGATAMAVQSDTATARARAEEALELEHELGDAWGIAVATQLLGN